MDGRIIQDGPATGTWNMAVDEALLLSGGAEASSASWTLRFYTWSAPTLSLGYFQRHGDRSLHEASKNCPLVRRASGGGAIMHDRELTYSFIAPVNDRFAASVEEIYDLFHGTLIDAIGELTNAQANLCVPSEKIASKDEPFLCFQRRAKGDVLIDGYKVCGSAQRRNKRTVLQHGSVLLDQSPFAPELPGIVQLTGKTVTSAQLTSKWQEKLSAQLSLPSQIEGLNDQERQQALEIEREKFAAGSWTERR